MANRYPMGNSGDLIKHGLLAEFVEWWSENHEGQTLQVADTFAGCPWGKTCDKVKERLSALEDCALKRVYPQEDNCKYLGSSHLVRQVAESRRLTLNIDMSDKCDDVRCLLGDSIAEHKNSMRLISLPEGNDGYAILGKKNWKRDYNLILIDPYSGFLWEEFRVPSPKHFTKILNLMKGKGNEELFVAVFVLDKNKSNSVGKAFCKFKREELRGCSFSLRCPRIVGSNLGESCYDFEILLISGQIAATECRCLRARLTDFADKATRALQETGALLLSKGEVEFWPHR